jgi:type I restriction-modification system DNA methylase subunit/restriction endonuclease S subunit
LNILRDNEGLTGEKALRTLSYLLILKLLEPHFGGEIDIDNYNYDFSHIEDNMVDNHKNKLLKIVRFSILSIEKEDNIPVNMKWLWDDILAVHPTTKNIFLKDKGFDIQHKSTYKKLIDKLNAIDLTDMEYDIIGSAYEEVIQDIMTGKILGQFFTQPSIKKMMVKLIDPQIHPDGKIDTCGDPTMGTGGFLITYLQCILQQAKEKNISPDWNFIKTEGLYGKELEPDTYQLAVSNMLISSGHMFENVERGDSIREPITKKFDNILANPPFGIKGLKYDDFQSPLKREYIPIKTDNAVSLFIQAIIYMLKIEGKCAVVLPDGQDLFSKSNNTLVAIREYLMKTCDLKEIIYLPSGIFTYTSIKTCVFYFVKKAEGCDVLETKIKISKTQKETGREYKFPKTHQTTDVKFYEYNPTKEIKTLLIEVPIESIANNSYSLNYAEYMKTENKNKTYDDSITIKTLGEICDIDYGTRIVRGENTEGEYPVFGSGRQMFSTETYNREGFNILIGRFALSAECVRFVNGNIFLNDSGLTVKPKIKNTMHKYIGYYLFINQYIIYECARGTAQKNLDMNTFKNIKIPVPTLERQTEIVKYLDFIYEKSNKTSANKIDELKTLNEFCLNNQKEYGINTVKTLGEICNFDIGGTPLRCNDEYYKNGNNLWVSIRELNGGYIYDTTEKITDLGVQKSSVKLFAKDTVLFSFKLSIGKTAIVGNPLYSNEAIAGILSKNTSILDNKYLYHYLSICDFSKFGSGILGNGSLNKKSLEQIQIIIPSIARQREIVEYCEYNNTLIKQLEIEIENNKKQAQLFINSIIKTPIEELTIETPEINEIPPTVVDETPAIVEEVIPPQPVRKIIKKIKKITIVKETNNIA